VNARRILTTAAALAWLLPTLVSGAVALHVSFEHATDEEHHASPNTGTLSVAFEHGHLHESDDPPHRHAAIADAAPTAARRTIDAPIALAAHGAPRNFSGADAELVRGADPTSYEHSRGTGPPLLARLSTFRI
jgi:hypothetical protein